MRRIRTLCEADEALPDNPPQLEKHVGERKDWLEDGKDPGGAPEIGTKPYWQNKKAEYQ